MMDEIDLGSRIGAIDARLFSIETEIKAAKRTMFRAAWVIFLTVLILLLGRYPEVVSSLHALRGL